MIHICSITFAVTFQAIYENSNQNLSLRIKVKINFANIFQYSNKESNARSTFFYYLKNIVNAKTDLYVFM